MKLRNKKTGEIRELPDGFFCGDNLKKICEEWEDYEEPKEAYYIDFQGGIHCADIDNNWSLEKIIGNYFETKEEAEKAVEKLKAWKRLKDKGFRFKKWDYEGQKMVIQFYFDKQSWATETEPDLDLLFGGKE